MHHSRSSRPESHWHIKRCAQSTDLFEKIYHHTVYPNDYAHGFARYLCFASILGLVEKPVSYRVASGVVIHMTEIVLNNISKCIMFQVCIIPGQLRVTHW